MKKDYQDLKIELNIKTLMMFEHQSGKSFYDIEDEDFPLLVYCSLVTNNNYKLTFSRFQLILENEKIAKQLIRKCQEEFEFMSQFQKQTQKTEEASTEDTATLSDIVNTMVINYGLDINYVMYDMRLWELQVYMKGIDDKAKSDMAEKRFWTYLNICPHIDSKKIKGPEQLLPFPWEKEIKKQRDFKELENNRFAIQNMIGKNIFGEPIDKKKE